jgi:hypothetical protein
MAQVLIDNFGPFDCTPEEVIRHFVTVHEIPEEQWSLIEIVNKRRSHGEWYFDVIAPEELREALEAPDAP